MSSLSLAASVAMLNDLIEHCEGAESGGHDLDLAIANACYDLRFGGVNYDPGIWVERYGGHSSSLDMALTLLPDGADWRKLTHPSMSVYAANPYNAQAQKRIDGNGATPALQMCAAAMRLRLEPLLKASAIEARRAKTRSGLVHESAVPQAGAPTPSPSQPTPFQSGDCK